MTSFSDFNLPPALATSLARMNYNEPTPIQAQAIPLAMQGRDILGSAQTGTGKTAAFAIPMICRIMASPRGSALVMTPTRELAAQVMEVIKQLLGQRSFIPTALLIGGDSMPKQIAMLRMRPRIIVGTPGRIFDHLERGNLILHDASYLVLDETDRMLDMGFGIQIERIVKYLPQQGRQTLMFSATLPPEIVKLSGRYLNNPERIAVGATNAPILKIQQEIIHVTDGTKYEELLKQLDARTGSIVLFVKTKRGADRMCEKLSRKYTVDAIHGDLHQRKRERVIQAFRDQKFRILVATDIASRGLDIPHIEHVINYDLPQCPEDYIHRIGRTARNGSEGAAVCLISPDDHLRWRDIHKLLYPGEPMPHLPQPPRGPHGGGSHGKPGHSGKKNHGNPRFRNGGRRDRRPQRAPSAAA